MYYLFTQAGEFFFADITNGQFPCPVCRSLGNGILPYIPIDWIVLNNKHDSSTERSQLLKWDPLPYLSNLNNGILSSITSNAIWDFDQVSMTTQLLFVFH